MPKSLTPLELLTLVAIARLGDGAYAVPIREEIKSVAGRTVSVAAIYGALDRLDRLGFAAPWQSDPRPEPGGRSRRHYRLTAPGREFVRRERTYALRLWNGFTLDAPRSAAGPGGRR
jgi:DNA-binding PadR family transcriptional regulator